MLNLSITPLFKDHIDEICEDIIAQQRDGISDIAMFMMTLQPDSTPPVDKAAAQCALYDSYRERLDKAGAKHGILAQATLGHIVVPSAPYPFSPTVSLITGEPSIVTCCPLDPGFREYIKGQMRTIAQHNPSAIMIDDDVGILYRATKGCACRYHMAEFNRRAGTNMSREELYAHTQCKDEDSQKYTQIYVDVVRDSLVGAVQAMREGIDEVNPKIQGMVSGIYASAPYCEFSDLTATAFAGEGNPRIVRMNGAPYAKPGMRHFTENIARNALIRENVKHTADVLLAETDTCPHNRYSTSAAHMHMHYVAAILEGAQGAKHWITRNITYEPISGRAYRKILAKHKNFYSTLSEYTKQLRPFGCRMPLSVTQNYGFIPSENTERLMPWSTCVLERLGLPTYFGNAGDGAVFVEHDQVDAFDDATICQWLSGTLVLSVDAADKLNRRGFNEYIGVEVREWTGDVISREIYKNNTLSTQYGIKELVLTDDRVVALTEVIHRDPNPNTPPEKQDTKLFPGVTLFRNSLGGKVIVFCGSPDIPFAYYTIASLLCESRKQQLVELLREHLPLYYPEDAEIYLRAGYLPNGEMLAALFNIGFDPLEEIPLVVNRKVESVWTLDADGERRACEFTQDGENLTVHTPLEAVTVKVLIIQ